MHSNFKSFLIITLCLTSIMAKPQFWQMNQMSAQDMFIYDVKSTMSAGICYKKVPSEAIDPELRMRTISFCCDGYKRNPLSPYSVKCDPVCSEDCNNGICSAPDVCECFPSYERKGGRCESLYK